MELNIDSAEKVVSLIAGLIAIGGFVFFRKKAKPGKITPTIDTPQENSPPSNNAYQSNKPSLTPPNQYPDLSRHDSDTQEEKSILSLKRDTKILFIDDDSEFKIVNILKRMGWEYTSIVTDITSLEQTSLIEADVVFVDIQGVGVALQLSEEGLGLALAIKRRYPNKKVIIYSSREDGARFHVALQEADYSLPKTADPIRFEETIMRVLKK
ncbi:DNA-binding transcriptional response regulator [Aeromonas dhakensis]|uniref:hypothetical protein n=1 Tax=Aeromonas dhakensis TaxID=196024 RepID=UPI0038D12677